MTTAPLDASLILPAPAAGDIAQPAFAEVRGRVAEACRGWVTKYGSADTRANYRRDAGQFLAFCGLPPEEPERLLGVRPHHVTAWRDHLTAAGLTNNSVRRKLTVLRSLFGYLQRAGLIAVNPAHSDFVAAPAVPRDGKTVGLAPADCRRLLDAPPADSLIGMRDRALLSVLAFTGCRVGELTRLKVGSIKTAGVHRVVEVMGKGGKERRVPLHPEAAERLEAWLAAAGLRDDRAGPLFRARRAPTAADPARFAATPLTRRAVQKLVAALVRRLKLDPCVSVHSLRVTALTTARERGCDVIDLQDFAGHSDPRTTLTYIRNRDRLSKSPAYVLAY